MTPPANATGVVAELNLAGTVAFATELQPDTRNLFVVVGAPPSNALYVRAAREQFAAFAPGLAITYLEGLRTEALEARLRTLPPHSIVYYLAVDRDGANEQFNTLEYLDRVSATANAPVYCWVSSAMDHGIVGGSLKDQPAQMRALGTLALRVLRGENAESIQAVTADLNVRQVDWRQLRRWGISESRVPAGTVIRFREASLWDRYRSYIVTAAALLLAQTALIAGLLVQRIRRREAEAMVHKNQAELRQSYDRIRDLASRLLTAQEGERARIARELHDDISQQMALLEIDLEQLSGVVKGQAQGLTHEALQRTQGISRSVHDLSHRLHPSKLRLIGLVGSLEGLRRELTQPEFAITFTHENVPVALDEELTVCLFRIVQEAVQNAIKYSGGRHVGVDLRGCGEHLTLTVSDDGVGFDVASTWQKGLGLVSMRERLEAVGGSLEIHSRPGAGTRLQAAVPLRARDAA
jgi:signal transduction histidine kinase